ncbi:Wadjet anti-phage system protein JetD domain-containing protein [Micromonospora aurantiaca (nom. illeg.)]|uniref:Wadjet anti-phage system protein JetD domain-containing protein n=1 Tax=Micromonospora aurantiaca (nom. illeg.) TaxID=47850 RepID=UPI00114D29A2|nr:Wadjet anti-phage system protein JetD domain-containing protein [Micromonospora aurantiaca]
MSAIKLGHMCESGGLMHLVLGESEGRVPVAIGGLPFGTVAVSVPVRRGGQARVPRNRRGLLRIEDIDLISGGAVNGFDRPPGLTDRELGFVLAKGRREWSTISDFFGPNAWARAVELVRCGGVVLRCATDADLHLSAPLGWRLSHAWASQAPDLLAEIRGYRNPDAVRGQLLDLMSGVEELADEFQLLAECPAGTPLRVPAGTATGTAAWTVYESAVRTASVWWPFRLAGEEMTAHALAAKALRDSKGWTPQRAQAFANLIGISFDQAVTQTDTDLRMRGPLLWRVGDVAANAATAVPWIAVPAKGLHVSGVVQCAARGVLVIENADTFEQVCKLPGVAEAWLCVWGEGYVSHGLVPLIANLPPLPLAAWCDLDADGIGIIHDLSKKLNRPVRAVGMDLELWQTTEHRKQKPALIERDQARAAKLCADGPEDLRSLAGQIAARGGSCEQQAIHDKVLPRLAERLEALLA